MRIRLIDYTGCGHADPLYAAKLLIYTKNTRLEQGEETHAKVAAMTPDTIEKELAVIANTIRSSWEFVTYTFEIRDVTRAFTHQLVRTRYGVSFAQQAQRVVDMTDFEAGLPDSVTSAGCEPEWNALMDHIRATYGTLRSAGVPAQDARGVLPTNVMTNIIAKIDLRALADLIAKRENLRAQGEYADVAREMAQKALSVHPWTYDFLYPKRTRTPALDRIMRETLRGASPVDKPVLNAALKEIDALKGTWG
jgi:flavin-dependent thymidylate synthase